MLPLPLPGLPLPPVLAPELRQQRGAVHGLYCGIA